MAATAAAAAGEGVVSHSEMEAVLRSVTVFADRAQLWYSAPLSLPPGVHALSLKEASGWQRVHEATLQVKVASGAAAPVALRTAMFHTVATTTDLREEVVRLTAAIAALEDELHGYEDEVQVSQATVQRYATLRAHVVHLGQRRDPDGDGAGLLPEERARVASFLMDPTRWSAMTAMLVDGEVEEQLRQQRLGVLVENVKERLAAERRKLHHLAVDVRNPVKTVVTKQLGLQLCVGGSDAAPKDFTLLFGVVVSGASWAPLYDLHVDSAEAQMTVQYRAQVRQCTTVGWTNVELKLSTARQEVGTAPPPLQVWNISLTPPMCTPQPQPRSVNCLRLGGGAPGGAAGYRAPAVESAAVQASSLAATYAIAGRATVANNWEEVKVTIAQMTFPIAMEYVAVPKLDPFTYILAKATNTSAFTLLPGKCNVFADNIFVNNAQMNLVVAGEAFTTALGTEEQLTVTRSEVAQRHAQKSRFLTGNARQIQFVYDYVAKSALSRPVTLRIRDQLPIAENSFISVVHVAPSSAELEAGRTHHGLPVTCSDVHEVEWTLALGPQSKQQFEHAFTVEYPEGKVVTGL